MSNYSRKKYRGFKIEYFQDEYQIWESNCYVILHATNHNPDQEYCIVVASGGSEESHLECVRKEIDDWYLAKEHDLQMDVATAQYLLNEFKKHLEEVKNERFTTV